MKRFAYVLAVVMMAGAIMVTDVFAQAAGAVSRAILQSQDDQIEAVLPPAGGFRTRPGKEEKLELPPIVIPKDETAPGKGKSGSITNVVLEGDLNWLVAAKAKDEAGRPATLSTQVNQAVLASKGDLQELENSLAAIQQRAMEAGWLFATFNVKTPSGKKKTTATIHVDAGHVKDRNIQFVRTSGKEVQRDSGRYFSRRQVENSFRAVEPGAIYNHNDLVQNFYSANHHPDLTVHPHLRAAVQPDDGVDTRVVDVDLSVEERMPIHGTIGFDNYGTDLTDNWTARVTLQHLNLTKANDVLSVNAQAATDWGALYGLAASYFRPFSWWKGGSWTVYGGWSDVESEDVLPDLDVKGYGYFGGIQGTLNLIDNPRRQVSASLGLIHRYVKDRLVFLGEQVPLGEVTIMPFSATLSYTDKQADPFGGFNFATLEGIANFGDFLGTSDDDEIKAQRLTAEADYMMLRANIARLQRLGSARPNQWLLFLRGTAQLADGPLIPAEQMGLGGSDNIRGYDGREFLGDDGVAGTIELRTPVWGGPISWTGDREPGNMHFDRLQFIVFGDVGYISRQDALAEEIEDKTLSSLGLGVRYALRENFQLKFDWGFPLKETEESDHSGRGYLNVQLQF